MRSFSCRRSKRTSSRLVYSLLRHTLKRQIKGVTHISIHFWLLFFINKKCSNRCLIWAVRPAWIQHDTLPCKSPSAWAQKGASSVEVWILRILRLQTHRDKQKQTPGTRNSFQSLVYVSALMCVCVAMCREGSWVNRGRRDRLACPVVYCTWKHFNEALWHV